MRRALALALGALVLALLLLARADAQACAVLNNTATTAPFCASLLGVQPLFGTNATAVTEADTVASASYDALQLLLRRYDCNNRTYSLWNCSACQDAYRAWACATLMPTCLDGAATRPCRPLCFDVIRKCPPTLAFYCPTDPYDQTVISDPPCATLNLTTAGAALLRARDSLWLLALLVIAAVVLASRAAR